MTGLSQRWLQRNVRPEQRGRLLDWRGVPPMLRAEATAVVRNPREAESLVEFYGSPDYQPTGGVVMLVPGQPPVYISHIRYAKAGRQEPVNLTAKQLRDIAADTWWAAIAEVMDDPDRGRFQYDELMDLPPGLRWQKLTRSRLARILVDRQNAVLHPKAQPWQDQNLTVVRP